MSVAPVAIARPLSAVVCDLVTTKQRLACHYARLRTPTDDEDRDWQQLEDRRDALEDEMRKGLRAATGLDWILISEVMS